jgi:hypothetical protein
MMSKFRVAPANMVKLIRLELNVRFAPILLQKSVEIALEA